MVKKNNFFGYFLRATIDPPIIDRIASINPNSGTHVCCIGTVVVAAFTVGEVVVIGFVGSVGVIGSIGLTYKETIK